MKKIKFMSGIFLFLYTSVIYSQKIDIQVKFSKENAVLIFLENLVANSDNEFKSVYNNSKYNTPTNNKHIEEFKNLNWYFSKNGFKSTRYFKSICIKSSSWSEIRNQSIGLFKDKTLDKLISLLKWFEPIYDELIYWPAQDTFIKQLNTITNLVKEKNISHLFTNIKDFFNSYWNVESPLIITFYPIPNAEGYTAKTYGNTVTSGIPETYNNFPKLLSVIIHEVSHMLYYNTNEDTYATIDETFNTSKSNTSLYAKYLFDEAIATTIGNGIVYQQLTGKEDKGSWYYHKYINLMAKEMVNLTQQYLVDNKRIDNDFIKSYLDIYNTKFSGWLGEPKNLMTYHTILANEKAQIEYLRSKFRYGNIYDDDVSITFEALKKFTEKKLTKIIIIDRNHKQTLQNLHDIYPNVNLKKVYDKNFIFNTLLLDNTQLIVINSFTKSVNTMIDHFSKIEQMKINSGAYYY